MHLFKSLFFVLCILAGSARVSAQLSNGSIAPDFTFTDINGTAHNLYSYLNQGKYVAIDASATWCQPCWNYHNTKVFDSLYQSFDGPGTQEWKLLFVEIDGNTGMDDLQGLTSASQGDWLTGTGYTILNPPAGTELSDFINGFNIGFYPTFYLICPDKRVYHLGGSPLKGVWTGTTDSCATTSVGMLETSISVAIAPVPAHGKVEIAFSLPGFANVYLAVTTADGRLIDKKIMRVASGETRIPYDVRTLPGGLYFFSFVTDRHQIITKKVVIQ